MISERLRQGGRALLDPHPRVRDRRPLDEARRRGDHARHPEPLGGVAQGPRRARRRAHRRRGRLRRPARRQGDAEGRDRADGRGEADPRDLQGEGARGPRHEPQGPARRGRQGDRREDVLARGRRRPVAGRERARPRVRREEAQDRRGRQARRPPRQQGRDREDRARGGHAVPGGRAARRRRAQPARRAEPDEHRPDPRDAPRLGGGARRLPARTATPPTATHSPIATPVFDGATRGGRRRGARRVDEAEPRLADQVRGRREAAGGPALLGQGAAVRRQDAARPSSRR